MPRAFDGTRVPEYLPRLACGGTPGFDSESGIGAYRCDYCFAVIGSIAQSADCKKVNQDEADRKLAIEILGFIDE